MKKMILKILNMHCPSCAINIDGELEDLKGVISSSTSYAKSQTTVEYDEKIIKEKDLVGKILALNFGVTILSSR